MDKNFGKDLTTGSIPRHLLVFSLPMLVGNMLQVAYSIVNTIWVGKFVGPDAVGATAVSFPIIFILIALASGATLATTILVSQFYGARDMEMVEKVVNTSFSVNLIMGAALTVFGIAFGDSILRMMDTPAEIFPMASSYLKISIAGFVLIVLSNLIPSILRGIGDTVTPLIFMGIGLGINAILDPFMIIGIGPFPKLGIDGAAYASLIAQFIAVILAIVYLNRKNHFVAVNPRKLTFDLKLTGLILKLGFPSMVQQSLVSIGVTFVTGFVNTFGASATAAFGAAGRIENIVFLPAITFGMAASALTGQNLGAGKPERVKEIFKAGIRMTSVVTLTLSALIIIFPRLLLSMFVQEPAVLDIGVSYLRIVGCAYILFALMFISNGIINGSGHTMITMVFSLVSLWVIRVPLAAVLSRTQLGISGIWLAIDISFAVTLSVSLVYYFSGRWKKEVIRKNKVPAGTPEEKAENDVPVSKESAGLE
jgi:putative MATE family efflux protein